MSKKVPKRTLDRAESFRKDTAVAAFTFADDTDKALLMIFHLVGVAHELALAVYDNDESEALRALSEAVNHGAKRAIRNVLAVSSL